VSALVLRFEDVESLTREIEQNLARGRAFLAGASGVEERCVCELVLVHPATEATLTLSAEAVYVKRDEPGLGVGLQLAPFGPDVAEKLRAFAKAECEQASDELIELPDDAPIDESAADAAMSPSDEPPVDDVASDAEAASKDEDPVAKTLHARLRHLSLTEQQRLARAGTLQERVMLERMYGPSVWEGLLANTRLTIPEVARIAKKGTLPKPLLDVIAANGAWLAGAEVQRALLSNPRTQGAVLQRVLRALSRTDLARVPQQTAYPMATRMAAKKLIKDG
jgi:hypothetical protein